MDLPIGKTVYEYKCEVIQLVVPEVLHVPTAMFDGLVCDLQWHCRALLRKKICRTHGTAREQGKDIRTSK
jgi:hypothetical protein